MHRIPTELSRISIPDFCILTVQMRAQGKAQRCPVLVKASTFPVGNLTVLLPQLAISQGNRLQQMAVALCENSLPIRMEDRL